MKLKNELLTNNMNELKEKNNKIGKERILLEQKLSQLNNLKQPDIKNEYIEKIKILEKNLKEKEIKIVKLSKDFKEINTSYLLTKKDNSSMIKKIKSLEDENNILISKTQNESKKYNEAINENKAFIAKLEN